MIVVLRPYLPFEDKTSLHGSGKYKRKCRRFLRVCRFFVTRAAFVLPGQGHLVTLF